MRRLYIVGLGISILLSACTSAPVPVSEKMRIVVDSFEQKEGNLTQEQFATYDMQYNNLLQEVLQNGNSMTTEEKERIAKEVARYNGLKVRYGVESTVEFVQGMSQTLPAIVEGFLEGFNTEDGMESLELKFKQMLDKTVQASKQIKSNESNLLHIKQSLERMMEDAEKAGEEIDTIFN